MAPMPAHGDEYAHGVRCSFRVSSNHRLHGDEAALLEVTRWDIASLLQCDITAVGMRGVEQGRGYLDLHAAIQRLPHDTPDNLAEACEALANADLPWTAKYLQTTTSRMASRILILEGLRPGDTRSGSVVSLVKQGNDIVVQPVVRSSVMNSPSSRPCSRPTSPSLGPRDAYASMDRSRSRSAAGVPSRWSGSPMRGVGSVGGRAAEQLARQQQQEYQRAMRAPPARILVGRQSSATAVMPGSSSQYGFRSASPRVHTFARGGTSRPPL